jgi:hypothetical protein
LEVIKERFAGHRFKKIRGYLNKNMREYKNRGRRRILWRVDLKEK